MLLPTLTALLATSIFQFGGGTDWQLAESIHLATTEPVILMADPKRIWPQCRFEYRTAEELKKQLRLRFDIGFGKEAAWLNCFACDFYMVLRRASYKKSFKPRKLAVEHKGDTVSCSSPAGPVPIEELFSPLSEKRVSWHWFYSGAYFVVDAPSIRGETYFNLLEKAIGGKPTQTERGVYLDFDPKTYRVRGIATLKELERREPMPGGFVGDYKYSEAVLNWISDTRLSKLFNTFENQTVVYDAGDSLEIQHAASARLRNRFPVENDGVKRDPSVVDLWDTMKKAVNWNIPCKVVGSTQGVFGTRYMGMMDGKPFAWDW